MKKNILIIFSLFLTTTMVAQEGALRKADRSRNDLAYAEAIDRYTNLLNRGVDSSRVALGLAESYFALRDMQAAAEWYGKAGNLDSDEVCRFAHALRSTGNADQAEILSQGCSNESYSAELIEMIKTDNGRFNVQKEEFNTEGSEFGPCFLDGDLVFVSDRENDVAVKRRFKWNGRPFLDLYMLTESVEGTPEFTPLPATVNTALHEGPGCFINDGETFYFTRNQANAEGDQTRKLEILVAEMVAGEWRTPTGFTHNSADYSTGHPTITRDGEFIAFTSDMEGGLGGTDIWICQKMDDGNWGTPVNAGPTVNTPMNEMFPHFGVDEFLYFSSDGHANLGGLDVFEAPFTNGSCGTALNLGAPVNSTADDFSFTLREDQRVAYFASNRENEATNDDLYKVKVLKDREWNYTGVVVDDAGTAVMNCTVNVLNATGEVIGTAVTNSNGIFDLVTDVPAATDAELTFNAGPALASAEKAVSACNQEIYTLDAGTIELTSLGYVGATVIRDKATNEGLEEVRGVLTKLGTDEVTVVTTTNDGNLNFDLDPSSSYELTLSKEGYFTKSVFFNTNNITTGVNDLTALTGIDLNFEKIEVNMTVRIENINYDYNDYRIRQDAATELDKIIALLNDNPTMKIELGSHTDARGSDSYNLKLSQKRAKAAVEYLIQNGIAKNRLTSRGYGETVLINNCGNGNDCSDEDHEINRRTEFRVTEF
ncbi:OmpA family protein [Sanyastnella coralliicola]|uniref:OmpA family protein n=1 Tax=Sanyastnella coralliicola TaxID=3069118 RepID=UPI0027BA891B|nr:OmpA family protein [Longitalea sp. SCSIO 12813]